jgi:hypothetical protein
VSTHSRGKGKGKGLARMTAGEGISSGNPSLLNMTPVFVALGDHTNVYAMRSLMNGGNLGALLHEVRCRGRLLHETRCDCDAFRKTG